jgi:hypothetical protein
MLHAALWRLKGDFGRATRTATGIGRTFGYALIAVGVVLLVRGDATSGVWMAFLGWFLLAAAGAEGRYGAARHALQGLRVADLMAPEPVSVEPDLTLGQFMDEVVWRRRYTTYPVVVGEVAVGLLPFRRVAEVPPGEWDARRVRDCMPPVGDGPLARTRASSSRI